MAYAPDTERKSEPYFIALVVEPVRKDVFINRRALVHGIGGTHQDTVKSQLEQSMN